MRFALVVEGGDDRGAMGHAPAHDFVLGRLANR